MDGKIFKNEEKVIFALRELYGKYGYLSYRMSKFEEYELYIRHKEFMVSDRVIAFNDTNGKLLALKPDVTMSIIKSGEDIPGVKQKVYYNENVYRVSSGTHRYKEIMQTGLECIGDTDMYDTYEVVSLAAESLSLIKKDFVLAVSHLGVISSVINSVCDDGEFGDKAVGYLSGKNTHDLKKLCDKYGVDGEGYEKISSLARTYGDRKTVIAALEKITECEEIDELKALSVLLDNSPYSDRIQFDFSLMSNTSYYNGFVFKGFVDGVASDILSGGQYDRMMEKMNRKSRAIGFAIYVDMLENEEGSGEGYDVDFLLLYDGTVSYSDIARKTEDLLRKGFTCSAQKAVPEKLKYKEIIDMRREGAIC